MRTGQSSPGLLLQDLQYFLVGHELHIAEHQLDLLGAALGGHEPARGIKDMQRVADADELHWVDLHCTRST